MPEVFSFDAGSTPLLVSIPHDGRLIPPDILGRLSDHGRDIPDTDWHVERLYSFARDLGATLLVARYSRYVVDLNRPSSDEKLYAGQVSTGLCPRQTFAGDDIYADGSAVGDSEVAGRIEEFWQPYHDRLRSTLDALRQQFGYALLWDAHSIPGVVPRLFDGELPVLNIGTYAGRSCRPAIANRVCDAAAEGSFSWVRDGRFKGGYITRAYGAPEQQVHALQLEIAQRAYMDETSREFDESRANLLRRTLSAMLAAYLDAAKRETE